LSLKSYKPSLKIDTENRQQKYNHSFGAKLNHDAGYKDWIFALVFSQPVLLVLLIPCINLSPKSLMWSQAFEKQCCYMLLSL